MGKVSSSSSWCSFSQCQMIPNQASQPSSRVGPKQKKVVMVMLSERDREKRRNVFNILFSLHSLFFFFEFGSSSRSVLSLSPSLCGSSSRQKRKKKCGGHKIVLWKRFLPFPFPPPFFGRGSRKLLTPHITKKGRWMCCSGFSFQIRIRSYMYYVEKSISKTFFNPF